MKLPSDNYFKYVKSEQIYNDFLATGMMFEVEPCAPSSWQEHLEMVDYLVKFKWCGIHERACNCPPFVSRSGKKYHSQGEAIKDSLSFEKDKNEGNMNNAKFVEVSLKDVVEHFAEGFYSPEDSNMKYKLERYSVDQGKGTVLFVLQHGDKEYK